MWQRSARPLEIAAGFVLGIPSIAWAVPEVRITSENGAGWLAFAMSLVMVLITNARADARTKALLEGPGGVLARLDRHEDKIDDAMSKMTAILVNFETQITQGHDDLEGRVDKLEKRRK